MRYEKDMNRVGRSRVDVQAVSILVADHFGGVSGGQRSVLQLIARGVERGWTVNVACPLDRSEFANLAREQGAFVFPVEFNVKDSDPTKEGAIYRQPWRLLRYVPTILRSVRTLKSLIADLEVDVVYGNSFKASALVALASNVGSPPLVMRLRTSREYSSHGWIDYFLCRRADLLLANSRYVADTFARIIKDKNKLKVLYNGGGISPELLRNKSYSRGWLRRELNLPDNAVVLGQVGRLTRRKRPRDLVQALVHLVGCVDEPIHCVFVGDKDSTEETRNVCEEVLAEAVKLDVAANITLLGERNDALEIINGLDVMVLASEGEPMARVVIEALGLQVPLIVSEDGGNKEIIQHLYNGLTFPLGDTAALGENLRSLLSNKSQARELSDNGLKTYLEHFCSAVTVDRELALIEACANSYYGRKDISQRSEEQ